MSADELAAAAAITATADMPEWQLFRRPEARRAILAAALEAAAPLIAAAERERILPAGAPLTHFFHCWRFPAHHACAVALIERQQVENDRLLVGAAPEAAAERERITALAKSAEAVYLEPCDQGDECTHGDHTRPFADLLDGGPS